MTEGCTRLLCETAVTLTAFNIYFYMNSKEKVMAAIEGFIENWSGS